MQNLWADVLAATDGATSVAEPGNLLRIRRKASSGPETAPTTTSKGGPRGQERSRCWELSEEPKPATCTVKENEGKAVSLFGSILMPQAQGLVSEAPCERVPPVSYLPPKAPMMPPTLSLQTLVGSQSSAPRTSQERGQCRCKNRLRRDRPPHLQGMVHPAAHLRCRKLRRPRPKDPANSSPFSANVARQEDGFKRMRPAKAGKASSSADVPSFHDPPANAADLDENGLTAQDREDLQVLQNTYDRIAVTKAVTGASRPIFAAEAREASAPTSTMGGVPPSNP